MDTVPIPAAPEEHGVPSSVLVLYGQLHQQVRSELDGLDDDALNWTPMPKTNSIATIITHLVGSESETIRCVAGVPCERDRQAEFAGIRFARADLLRLLDEADALIEELGPRIDVSRLETEFPLPTCPPDEERTGLTWLIGTYGHSREHLGQIQITGQLHRERHEDRG